MERNITSKILDNTVISAGLKEIKTINLIERCIKRYKLVTSKHVSTKSQMEEIIPKIKKVKCEIEKKPTTLDLFL